MAMVACPKCGEKISEASKKCIFCGVDLTGMQEEWQAQQAAAKKKAQEEAKRKAEETAAKQAETSQKSEVKPTKVVNAAPTVPVVESAPKQTLFQEQMQKTSMEAEVNHQKANDKVIAKNEKWFKVYHKLPLISAIVVMALVFIWSIVDVSVFHSGYSPVYYGVMRIPNAFLPMLIWWTIGAFTAAVTYFIVKFATCYMILHIEYLKKIEQNTRKN